MAKKYTVMIFDPEKYGKSKTLLLSTRPFWVVGIVLVLLLSSTLVASYLAYSFYQDSKLQQASVTMDGSGNAVFKAQFANYLQQLDELNSKMSELDELEYKVRELVSYQDGSRVVKQVAVGGKEVDILRDYYAFSDRREQEFFDSLNETLSGLPVRATAKGIVVFSGEKAGYGKIVTIDHGYGYMTRYGHNSSLTVKVGDKVEKGDVIAKVGSTGRSTGPHVHYEVLVNGIPVNPQKFIIDEN